MSGDRRARVAAIIAGFIFTVLVPSLVFAMIKVDPSVGWPLIGISVLIGIAILVWGFLPHHLSNWRQKVLPLTLMFVGFILYSGGAIWYYFSHLGSSPISFQKYAVFWVQIDKDMYEIGVVTKFFNFDSQPYRVKGITFDGRSWSFFPRGGYLIRRAGENKPRVEVLEDNYLKPNSEAYFKILLPIKFDMTVNGGHAPEFILRGKWDLIIGDTAMREEPALFSAYENFISLTQWNALLKRDAPVSIDDLQYKTIPPKPPKDGPDVCYLIYSPDRTANVENPYFAQTEVVRNQHGAMTFVCGKGDPPLGDSWTSLGTTYAEVWSDPHKLTLYNSITPPGADGLPVPFGFFAGLENAMAGPVGRPLSAPTTRAADILDFTWPEEPKRSLWRRLINP